MKRMTSLAKAEDMLPWRSQIQGTGPDVSFIAASLTE